MHQSAGQNHTLTLASAERATTLIQKAFQIQSRRQLVDAIPGHAGFDGIQVGKVQQHLADSQPGINAIVGRDHADFRADRGGIGTCADTINFRKPAVGREQAHDHAQGGGLTRTVGA